MSLKAFFQVFQLSKVMCQAGKRLCFVINVGRYFLEFPAHPSFFTNNCIERTKLFIGLKWKPALQAIQTNTLGSVIADKAKNRPQRTHYAGSQKGADNSVAIFMVNIVFRLAFRAAADNTWSTDSAVRTVMCIFPY